MPFGVTMAASLALSAATAQAGGPAGIKQEEEVFAERPASCAGIVSCCWASSSALRCAAAVTTNRRAITLPPPSGDPLPPQT